MYDAPGPRTRRRTLIASIVAGIVVVALFLLLVIRPLANRGQFSMTLWGPIIDPSNQYFSLLWQRLGEGFQGTLIAAALAISASLICGVLLAVLRIQLLAWRRRRYTGLATPIGWLVRGLILVLNAVTRFAVEVFRGLPVVITIFFVGRGLPEFGVDWPVLWYLVIGLTIYNMVVIAEILRSGMTGLPIGQREAADSLGLTPFQTTRLILLPQAFRIMLPALISQLVVVLKDTSLGFIISYEDLLNSAKLAVQVLNNPIQMYFTVGVIYIVVNYSLSKLAVYVQRRLERGRRAGQAQPVIVAPAAVADEGASA
ncbi:MAG TPA: amino acid ABC transporter permease [Micromonosporaceae bacterium]